MALALAPAGTPAAVVDGMETRGESPPHDPGRADKGLTPPPPDAVVVDFDGAAAPPVFLDAVALTGELAAAGVLFGGPGGSDGGAVLEGFSFAAAGFSPPNLLAFNLGATLSDGGTPRGPETMSFPQTVSHVQINAGNSGVPPAGMTLECFDGGGASVGQDTIAASGTLQTLAVSGPGIAECVFDFDSQVGVLDDLAFVVEPRPVIEVPTLSGPGLALLALLLAAAASRIARRQATSRA